MEAAENNSALFQQATTYLSLPYTPHLMWLTDACIMFLDVCDDASDTSQAWQDVAELIRVPPSPCLRCFRRDGCMQQSSRRGAAGSFRGHTCRRLFPWRRGLFMRPCSLCHWLQLVQKAVSPEHILTQRAGLKGSGGKLAEEIWERGICLRRLQGCMERLYGVMAFI